MKKALDTVSFFSGIGAFEKAATNLGINLNIKMYCEIDKWASTSYSAIHGVSEDLNRGDILDIDPLTVPNCDLITHGSPCFKAGTLIKTIDGLKKIENIIKGDMVLTHMNRFREVVTPMINYTEDIYELVTKNGTITYVTEEHPYYVRKVIGHQADKVVLGSPEWVTVKDLTEDNYIGQLRCNSKSEVTGVIWEPYEKKVELSGFNNNVYNFEVAEDNSYIANNCIVHNCQDFSVAGQNKGGNEGSETRSSLMWTTVNMIEHKMPKYVIWENVKGVLSKNHKHNFDRYIKELEDLGYTNYYDVLNAKNYGIPQNRDRVYVISVRNDIDKSMVFPEPFDNGLRLKHMLEDSVDAKYYMSKERSEKLLEELKEKEIDKILKDTNPIDLIGEANIMQINNPKHFSQRVYSMEGLAPTIAAGNNGGGKEPCKMLEPNQCKQILTIPKDILNDNERQRRVYSSNGISPTVLSRTDSAKILQVGMLDMKGSEQVRRVYDPEGIAPTLDTMQGGHREPKIICDYLSENDIQMIEVQQLVTIRKYEVDGEALVDCLREHKKKSGFTNRQIADKLGKPVTLIEHWFRRCSSVSIPDADVWYKLKELLAIETDEFDLSITTFVEQEGVYEKGNRLYHENGISPTLTTSGNERVIQKKKEINYANLYFRKNPPSITIHDSIKPSVAKNFEREKEEISESEKDIYQCKCDSGWQDNKVGLKISPALRAGNSHTSVLDNYYRIRKLTPLECWRLMGFDDVDYWTARRALEAKYYNGGDRSNSQMYKQAGNSIVVKVLEEIYKELFSEYIS